MHKHTRRLLLGDALIEHTRACSGVPYLKTWSGPAAGPELAGAMLAKTSLASYTCHFYVVLDICALFAELKVHCDYAVVSKTEPCLPNCSL